MIRQTPSRRLRVVALAVAAAGMVATAALAATSTACIEASLCQGAGFWGVRTRWCAPGFRGR